MSSRAKAKAMNINNFLLPIKIGLARHHLPLLLSNDMLLRTRLNQKKVLDVYFVIVLSLIIHRHFVALKTTAK